MSGDAAADDEPELEEVEDALVDGDVPYQRGTAQAALRHRNFRIVYFGTFASNIGTWMQNVVLGAYALKLTRLAGVRRAHVLRAARAAAVPVDARAGCSPTSSTGAASSSASQLAQLVLSFGLAALALVDDPSHGADRGARVRDRHRRTRSARRA